MKRILIALITFLLLTSLASAATLKVGPHEKYKTIQKAVDTAKSGDTIQVAAGTYKETVQIGKIGLNIYGQKAGGSYKKYPIVYGFNAYSGSGVITINGFYITKTGVDLDYSGGGNVVQNNYFQNCGIGVWGTVSSGALIKNNKITNGIISFYDTFDNTVTGNTITKSKVGIYIPESADVSVVKNTITYNQVGIKRENGAGYLKENYYKGNKINIQNVEV